MSIPLASALLLALAAPALADDPAPAPNPKVPKIASPEPVKDLGDVFQGDVKRDFFVVENRGDAPLEFHRVVPKCGCTIARLRLPESGEERDMPQLYDGTPFLSLDPGKSCELIVQFNSSGQSLVALTKELIVETNDPVKPRFPLTIKANVLRVADVTPPSLNLGAVTRGDAKTVEIVIVPSRGLEFDLKAALPVQHLETVIRQESTSDGRKAYRVTVTLLATAPLGGFSKTLQIDTTLDPPRPVKIPMYAHVRPAVVPETGNPLNSTRLDLGVKQPGEAVEKTFEIKNSKPEVPWLPREITVESPLGERVTAVIEEVTKGALYRVRVTVAKGVEQRIYQGRIVITAEHPDAATIEVGFQGMTKTPGN